MCLCVYSFFNYVLIKRLNKCQLSLYCIWGLKIGNEEKKMTENGQEEPAPNQTTYRAPGGCPHHLFFLPSFHYLSSLSMNSEILELDWQRTQNVTEYPHVTRLLLTKLGIKLWSQLPILHSFTNLSLSQLKISCIYWSSNTHHIPKISLHIFIQCLIMLKTGHIIEFAHTVSFVNTSVKFLAILKPC